jgi:hypothetical protein
MRVPAPKAIISPRALLLRLILEAIIPPKTREEVAASPQRNAFNITFLF